ncbi:isoleucine--tRNA ligase [Dietzia timorensis]|uniref:Isoleucine--tRNA ligase n=1 Tax=Dietzia timorensis TaxID=499555 RepID=A0A173LKN1_9ACTN|nr:isoleucine--tRNA ligase [Dietzia timorensis]ANI92174.1 Isoleucine--tRNA ligase [Dietzia timorensis]
MSEESVAGAGSVYPLADLTGGSGAQSPSFPAVERTVLEKWAAENTFQKSLENRKDAEEYVFYDGPPFANGLPHYGHLLTGYVKDVVPRYRTMAGYRVDRRFGWDCHGLPAELEAERQLGITDKSQITDMGIAEFNDYCRSSVLRYTGEWENYVTRQARWVDFENDYKTLDITFMESVMWAFAELNRKGLIYQGFRVLPYSWYEQTPLSNQESRLDDAYKMRQDPAVTVSLPLHGAEFGSALDGAEALVWTTTPWTLPSNLAAAVHPDIDYVVLAPSEGDFAGRKFVLAEARVNVYEKEFGADAEVLATLKGSELEGLTYDPPFDFFVGHENAFRVLLADYVTTESGTGIVHQAPAFGEEDMETCSAASIELVIPVGPDGKFTAEVPPYEGQLIFDANPQISRDLRAAGKIIRHETIEHSYPHSWRSGQPLIYMAVPSWFVDVSKIRDRMVELNQEIRWEPEHIRDGQFGNWLKGARDWNISRNRYWGAPIPVWVSDNPEYPRTDVYGSIDELERDFGTRPADLHRPAIDELVRPNPDDPTGQSMMRRVPEVLDCWFESGSMPFAQVHYPFENKDWFDTHNPGDFIVEYIGQTRGWFYNLHVLSTALFDRPAFRTVAAHGIVLGDDGQKMSKSKRNYPDVNEVFDRDGSDAMRWFLLSSPILRGGNLSVTEQGIREGVRQAMLPLWNSYGFFQLYASRKATWRTDSQNVLDRYILSTMNRAIVEISAAYERTDLAGACEVVRDVAETLTNWYVRRSRARFWAGEESGQDSVDAFDTLYTVLETLMRMSAPLLPMLTETIWVGLTGEESVHLTDFPEAADFPADDELVDSMDAVRRVVSAASAVRKAQHLRVRLPLKKLTVAMPGAQRLEPFTGIIADEINVREVELTGDVAAYGRFEFTCNARVAGPRLGKQVQQAIKALKSGDWELDGEKLRAGGIELLPGEFEQRMQVQDPDSTQPLTADGGIVTLDLSVDADQEAEGWARDRIREIQEARRGAGLEITDRIAIVLEVPENCLEWARSHADLIAGEVLATSIEVGTSLPGGAEGVTDLSEGVRLSLRKA